MKKLKKQVSLILAFSIIASFMVFTFNTAYASDGVIFSDSFENDGYAANAQLPSSGNFTVTIVKNRGWSNLAGNDAAKGIRLAEREPGNKAAEFWALATSTSPALTMQTTGSTVSPAPSAPTKFKLAFSIKTNGYSLSVDKSNTSAVLFRIDAGSTNINLYNSSNAKVPLSGVTHNPDSYQNYILAVDASTNEWKTTLYRDGIYLGSSQTANISSGSIAIKANFANTQATPTIQLDDVSLNDIDETLFTFAIDDSTVTDCGYIDVTASELIGIPLANDWFTVEDGLGNSQSISSIEWLNQSAKKFRINFASPLAGDTDFTLIPNTIVSCVGMAGTIASFKTMEVSNRVQEAIDSVNSAKNISDVQDAFISYAAELALDYSKFNTLAQQNTVYNNVLASIPFDTITQIKNAFNAGVELALMNSALTSSEVRSILENSFATLGFTTEIADYNLLSDEHKLSIAVDLTGKNFSNVAGLKAAFAAGYNKVDTLVKLSKAATFTAYIDIINENNDILNLDMSVYNTLLTPALAIKNMFSIKYANIEALQLAFNSVVSDRLAVESAFDKGYNITDKLYSENFDYGYIVNTAILDGNQNWNVTQRYNTSTDNFAYWQTVNDSERYNILNLHSNTTGSSDNAGPKIWRQMDFSSGKFIIQYDSKTAVIQGTTTINVNFNYGVTTEPLNELFRMNKDGILHSGKTQYLFDTTEWNSYVIIADTDSWTYDCYVNQNLLFTASLPGAKPETSGKLGFNFRATTYSGSITDIYFDNLVIGNVISGNSFEDSELLNDEDISVEKVSDGNMTINKLFKNNDIISKDYTFYVAAYTNDNQLVSVSIGEDKSISKFSEKELTADINVTSNVAKIKVFVWNDVIKALTTIDEFGR